MNRYGQSITWGTAGAPPVFTGTCTHYSYQDQAQRQLDEDAYGEYTTLILHSRKAQISFEARVTNNSTNFVEPGFLSLSHGAALTISGISGGVILCTRAVEKWRLGQPKTASIQATHFPDMSTGSDPTATAAGQGVNVFTPSQDLSSILHPNTKLIYGTESISTPTSDGSTAIGIVHGLELTRQLQITEDEPDPTGKILGAVAHGRLQTLTLDILATGAIPAVNTALHFTAPDGTPGSSSYYIDHAEQIYAEKRGKMYRISAVWIPQPGS